MTTTITDAELAERLRDVLDRVRDCGEQFIVEHDGKPIAMLGPVEEKKVFTWGDFIEWYRTAPRPDDKFADDLEEIIANQGKAEFPNWPS